MHAVKVRVCAGEGMLSPCLGIEVVPVQAGGLLPHEALDHLVLLGGEAGSSVAGRV